jgi:hypothetical protein
MSIKALRKVLKDKRRDEFPVTTVIRWVASDRWNYAAIKTDHLGGSVKRGSLEAHEREIFLLGVGVGAATPPDKVREDTALDVLATWKNMKLPKEGDQ